MREVRQCRWAARGLTTLETAETLMRARVQLPFKFLASSCCAIILTLGAVASTTTASSGRAASSAASPALVWSTWVWVEETPGRSVQKFTLWIGRVDGSRPRLLGQGRDPRISPDGRWIAYSHDEHTYLVSRAAVRGSSPVMRDLGAGLERRGISPPLIKDERCTSPTSRRDGVRRSIATRPSSA